MVSIGLISSIKSGWCVQSCGQIAAFLRMCGSQAPRWQRVRNPLLKDCSARAFVCLPQSPGQQFQCAETRAKPPQALETLRDVRSEKTGISRRGGNEEHSIHLIICWSFHLPSCG